MLDVVFRRSGEVYRYFGVPHEVWREFLRAPSKGTYLNTVFKEKGYAYERVEGWMPLPGVAAAAEGEASAGKGNAVVDGAGRGFRDVPDANVWGFYK